ncbi:MAG: hypothetical protein GC168_03420 [Candidatus Hydrogenedens sp.]|nr:hypothetical protein [Candidatus Hydrogenedens sp.]
MPAGTLYYGMPYHYLYGALGVLNKAVPIPPLLLLAIAQGAAFGLLLWAVWRLFDVVLPAVRDSAFALVVLGGGLGGIAGFAGIAMGWGASPVFQEAFRRWFVFDVVEGARGNLHLLQDRLYYTLPLALALLGWAMLADGSRVRSPYRWVPGVLLAAATLINFRVGPMVWAVALLPMLTGHAPRRAGTWTLGMAAGLVCALLIASRNPSHVSSSMGITREAIGLAAWAGASGLLIPPAVIALWQNLRSSSGWTRYAAGAGTGYLFSFVALYAGYHVYYGNLFLPLDFAAAVAVSDVALLGLPLGVAAVHFLPRRDAEEGDPPVWLALWFLGFLGVGVSAWGQGWFLQFAPQRLLVLCGMPLAALAAYGLQGWRWRRAYFSVTLALGITSIAFTWLLSHGPLFDTQARALLPWTRFAYITKAEAEAISQLDEGVVLTPSLGAPLYGDVIAARTKCSVVYGNGTLDFSRENMTAVRRAVARFYSLDSTPDERLALLDAWRVRYVFCPALAPVAPEVVRVLQATLPLQVGYAQEGVTLLERRPGE